METVNVHTLYSLFKKSINKKPYQILGTMKSLAISTEEYCNFYSSSTNLFQKKTFKIPNETQYPILKRSQIKYMSLKNKLNTFSFHDKKYQPKDLISPKKNRIIRTVFSEKKEYKIKENKKRKNINFFICDNNYGGKYNNKLLENSINNKGKYSRNRKYPPPDFYKNFHSLKNIYHIEEIKNPEERIKDFFMFLNTIFIQDNYSNLKYDEKMIFGHKEDYLSYIKDEFNYFYQKEKEVNKSSFLYHIFKTKDYGKVELFLKSARIDILDESYKDNKVIKSLVIPFNLMSLIYLINIEQLNQIIFTLLNKLNIIERNNILSEEESKNIFLEILSQIKYENNKVYFNLINKNYERYYSKIFYLETIQEVSDTIRYNYFLSDFYKKPDIIKVIDNTHLSVYSSLNSLNKKRIIFNNNINYYKLSLITQNNNKYKIKLIMPEISMIFNEYEKQLNHCLNKELFIYLYQINFMDWDFYILHYLFYQKNFRVFIGKALSLKNNFNLFLSKKIINLKNYKIEFPKNNSDNIKIDISSTINNSYKKYYLFNFYTYKFNINENDIEYVFSSLNQNNIDFCKFKSYIVYVFINNINKPNIYEFNFNFKQMRVLYFRSLFKNMEFFLKRLLYLKDDIICLDYKNFENFYSMTNNELYEFFYKVKQNNEDINIANENSKINSIILKIKEPHIEVISNNKQKINQFYIELNKTFLHILINSEVTEWNKIIEEKKSQLDFNKYVKYEELKVKKKKRKNIGK